MESFCRDTAEIFWRLPARMSRAYSADRTDRGRPLKRSSFVPGNGRFLRSLIAATPRRSSSVPPAAPASWRNEPAKAHPIESTLRLVLLDYFFGGVFAAELSGMGRFR